MTSRWNGIGGLVRFPVGQIEQFSNDRLIIASLSHIFPPQNVANSHQLSFHLCNSPLLSLDNVPIVCFISMQASDFAVLLMTIGGQVLSLRSALTKMNCRTAIFSVTL